MLEGEIGCSAPWKAITGQITGLPANFSRGTKASAQLSVTGFDLQSARIVWEAADQEPALGKSFTFTALSSGPQWIEAEAQMADGRRVFAVTNFTVK